MSRAALRFWGSAALAAGGWLLASSYLLPYDALGLEGAAERARARLLTLWTGGLMAIFVGLSGWIGHATPLGVKEVAEAGSVGEAIRLRKRAGRAAGALHTNFAAWLVATGALLVLLYFFMWGVADG